MNKTTDEYINQVAEFKRIAATIKGFEPRRILDDKNQLKSTVIKANGNNYIFLNERQSFTVDRFRTHLMMEQMFAHAKSIDSMVSDSKKTVQLVNDFVKGKALFTELANHVEGLRKNYFEDNLYRDHISMYMCTLFIVKEGADLTDWNIEEASRWIEDWVKEGLYAPDFFTLALMYSPSYMKVLRDHMLTGSNENQEGSEA